jgi:hypothetical protein
MKIANKSIGHMPIPSPLVSKYILYWILISTVMFSCKEDEVTPEEEITSVWVLDRLYFGRSMPNGEEVSEAAWDQFVDEVVTPRFPDGLTLWHAEGQWQDASGVIIQEATFILEVAHEDNPASDTQLDEIIGEYKARFQQESVLRVTEQIEVAF